MGKAQESSLGMTGVNFPLICCDSRALESNIKLNSRNQRKWPALDLHPIHTHKERMEYYSTFKQKEILTCYYMDEP